MTQTKTEARIRVETALQTATIAHPMTAEQVADKAEVGLALARHYIGRLMNCNDIVNLGKRRASRYAWAAAVPREVAESVSRIPSTNYTGEPASYTRPEGLRAFTLPSLQSGERVERRRPILIGAPQVARA